MICKNCNNKFTEKYSKWSNGDFCSKFCANSYTRKHEKCGTKKVKCITCGKEIEVDKRAYNTLCKCDDCRGYKKQKNEEFCLNCGKIRIKKYSGKYCNLTCQAEYEYKQFIKNWKNGKVDGNKHRTYIKKYLFEKYNNKCSKCGWGEINPKSGKIPLQIEHKNGNWENNKEENLDLLCPNCHSLTPTYINLNKGYGRYSKKIRYLKEKEINIIYKNNI